MKHTTPLVFLLSMLAASAIAQSSADIPVGRRIFLNSVLGISAPGFSDLNASLSKAGFLPLSGVYFARGAGLMTVFPKARLATIVNFSSYTGTATDATRSSWARGTTAGASLGVLARNTDRVQIIPYAGLAYSWFGTRLAKTAPVSTAFDGYINGPTNQQYIGNEQFMGNVGLHVGKPGIGRGALAQKILVGLRAGYMFPLAQPTWQTNGVTLSGGPSANTGGTYLHLVIGSSL
ncbi:hypothetical protein [Fibrella aquatilis]|uniref:Outer membrane protein beta-barrel domain-containing protein n=1 Tax=Fibrella aquatilis TaxID=2817059 RepID=A0A939JY76_9BACT|nr:hypothetical protein [Fibrella aquatilis]MBO0933727.1 hypothetical protein [Fibrella aquatilis]